MHEAECEGSAWDLAGRKRYVSALRLDCTGLAAAHQQRNRQRNRQQNQQRISSASAAKSAAKLLPLPLPLPPPPSASCINTNMRYFTQLCGEAVRPGLPMIGRLVFPCLERPRTRFVLRFCSAFARLGLARLCSAIRAFGGETSLKWIRTTVNVGRSPRCWKAFPRQGLSGQLQSGCNNAQETLSRAAKHLPRVRIRSCFFCIIPSKRCRLHGLMQP